MQTHVIATGSRYVSRGCERVVARGWLDFIATFPNLQLYIGDASGVDEHINRWAHEHLDEEHWHVYAADWQAFGKAAGPIRNSAIVQDALLASQSDRLGEAAAGRTPYTSLANLVCFACAPTGLANSRGTRDMVRRCLAAAVPVWLVDSRAARWLPAQITI